MIDNLPVPEIETLVMKIDFQKERNPVKIPNRNLNLQKENCEEKNRLFFLFLWLITNSMKWINYT